MGKGAIETLIKSHPEIYELRGGVGNKDAEQRLEKEVEKQDNGVCEKPANYQCGDHGPADRSLRSFG
jgi:hypothetical protein